MSDYIQTLPSDNDPVQPFEREIFDEILKNDKSTLQVILHDFKDPLLGGILFILLSLPFVEKSIQAFVPYANSSPTSSLVFRLLLFILLFYIAKNISSILL